MLDIIPRLDTYPLKTEKGGDYMPNRKEIGAYIPAYLKDHNITAV